MHNNNGHAIHCEGNPRAIKVLMYHRVVDDRKISDKHWTSVHVDDFRRQLELLEQWGFTPITFRDYRLFLEGRLDLPKKPIILTFDDGYLDTYEVAFPVMQEFGFKAVIFVLGDKNVKTNYWDHNPEIPDAPLMNGRQIVEMHEAGFEIGSHSLSHPRLTELTEDQTWEQICRSRILLEILLDAPVHTISYPFGLINDSIKEATKHAGYRFGCGVGSGPAIFGDDHFEIRRITILGRTTAAGFALRLLTPFQYYEWTRRKAGDAFRGTFKPVKGNGHKQEVLEPQSVDAEQKSL
ncbi:MAG: polysaccharide deacetylase family protein [Bacteroidota bacterium]